MYGFTEKGKVFWKPIHDVKLTDSEFICLCLISNGWVTAKGVNQFYPQQIKHLIDKGLIQEVKNG